MPGGTPCLQCSLRWHGFVALGLGGCTWCLANRRVSMPVTESEEHAGESRDGTGSGDRDVVYAFGNPQAGLTLRAQARLLILRGYVKDHEGAIRGDDDWVMPTPSGLYVPTVAWSDDT